MRVLQINTGVNTGSTGKIAEEIGKLLIANGHESYIAFGRGNRPSASELIRVGDKMDVYLHGVKTVFTDRHGFGSKGATETLIKQIEQLKPDAVGLHNVHGYYLNIEVLFRFLVQQNIPVVWTLHDCWAFTGHCTYFDDIACEKWKTECNHCPKLRKYPASFLADGSTRNFRDKKRLFTGVERMQFVVPSQWLGDLAGSSFLGGKPVQVVHNGVDLKVFRPVETDLKTSMGLQVKKVLMGCASIWDKRKGLEDLIRLQAMLPAEYVIVVVGLNGKQLKQLPASMIGISRTESVEQLVQLYSMADVFVNPTYQDNFPTTNIEALACGTPVVTYDTGGSPEAIDDATGCVVGKGDLDALGRAACKLSVIGKEQFTRVCRDRAEARFNKDKQFAQYIGIYENFKSKTTKEKLT